MPEYMIRCDVCLEELTTRDIKSLTEFDKKHAESCAKFPPAVARPCTECPWRRDSLAGYLGPETPEKWIDIAHSDGPVACHMTIQVDRSWEGAYQCAGLAQFRTNVLKSPRDRSVARAEEVDTSLIFGSNQEFLEHHNG